MKSAFLLIALSLLGFKTIAQDYPTPYMLEKIDSAKGTKDELFVKANEWVAKTFTDAKSVIQMSDKQAGKIIAKGVMKSYVSGILVGSDFYTYYTLTIDVKDNKYKCVISDFIGTEWVTKSGTYSYNANLDGDRPGGLSGIQKGNWEKIKDDCWDQANVLATNLGVAIKAKSDNW